MTFTVNQIAGAAEQSAFYVTPEGQWLRILFIDLDEGYLQGLDEDRGNEYAIPFEEIAKQDDPDFRCLTRLHLTES